jgi:hypothetical protein
MLYSTAAVQEGNPQKLMFTSRTAAVQEGNPQKLMFT